MQRLMIRDGRHPSGGGLVFPTLDDVLATLGGRVIESRWEGRDLHYCSKDDRDIPALEALDRGEPVRGSELLDSLTTLAIVINGEFWATDVRPEPWVRLKAVDSTWWEVLSAEPSVAPAVRSRFRLVEVKEDDEPAA